MIFDIICFHVDDDKYGDVLFAISEFVQVIQSFILFLLGQVTKIWQKVLDFDLWDVFLPSFGGNISSSIIHHFEKLVAMTINHYL